MTNSYRVSAMSETTPAAGSAASLGATIRRLRKAIRPRMTQEQFADAPPVPDPAEFRAAARVASALAPAIGGDVATMRAVLATVGATVTIEAHGLSISYGGVFAALLSCDDNGT